MGQIVVLEPHKDLSDLISINLNTYTGSEVIPRTLPAEVISILSILPDIELVVCREKIDGENIINQIAKYIKTHQLETQIIVLGEVPGFASEICVGIKNPHDIEKIVDAACKILGVNPDQVNRKIRPDFIPIPIDYFFNLETTCCDVYIKIKKSADENQFVKRIHNGDTFSRQAIKRYLEQGLKFFYIQKEYQDNFTNFLSDKLVAKLEDAIENEGINEQIEIISESFDIAIKEILNLGFTPATIQLTDGIISSMIKTIENTPEMSNLLHKVINSKSSYLYQHSHMVSIVASECLNYLGIKKKEQHEIMAYAAFFCDTSFVELPELAKITSYEQLENSKLNEQDWDLVFNHALEASVFITKNPSAPEGTDIVIKHHHGASNGKGFSVTNSADIPGLAKIFIVACEFVKEHLRYKETGAEPSPIISDLYSRYPDPEMVKAIKALENTLKKRKKK
ncbi:hypothetical protein OAT67_02725 [Bacteriovoracaceae bacterium]|nr:hypothetical protein [Bacteriovoracaceae bacterium]